MYHFRCFRDIQAPSFRIKTVAKSEGLNSQRSNNAARRIVPAYDSKTPFKHIQTMILQKYPWNTSGRA